MRPPRQAATRPAARTEARSPTIAVSLGTPGGAPDDTAMPGWHRRRLGAVIRIAKRVGGGSITAAWRVELGSGRPFSSSWWSNPPPGFFPAEAAGLKALAETRTLTIPTCWL